MEKCIVLIGMPGCGKTSIGKKLADITGLDFRDTDSIIEKAENMSIPEIFSVHGEDYFRKAETLALKNALERPGVVACGGGIVLKKENRELISRHTAVFIKRGTKDLPSDGRPVSKSRDINDIYKERLPLYQSCGDIEIDNTGIDETAVKIAEALGLGK
jgi:shikimate dehydrogenase